MFIDFFFTLRKYKIPVTPSEFFDFLQVIEQLSAKQQSPNSSSLYNIARYTLVKDTKYFDGYDLAFSESFGSILRDDDTFKKKLEEWLKAAQRRNLAESDRKKALNIPPEDLIKELEKRRKEQQKQHHGGNKWIGTGGTSPFGHSGFNPGGIRIGGHSQNRSGLATALSRRFQSYRTDEAFDIRQIKMCLKHLRELKKTGRMSLSISATIDASCQKGGEITPIFKRPRRNDMKVLLLADIGGSMTPHTNKVNKLFSACHQINHFKEFKSYYFHNIIYDHVYKDAQLEQAIPIKYLLRKYDKNTRVIILGDAAMAPYELFDMTGTMNSYFRNFTTFPSQDINSMQKGKTAFERMQEIQLNYPSSIWLNPDPKALWEQETVMALKKIFPMYFLSLDGLVMGIKQLLKS